MQIPCNNNCYIIPLSQEGLCPQILEKIFGECGEQASGSMVKYVHDATGEEIEWDDVDESSVDSLADSDGYWSLEDNARGRRK